MSDVFSCPTCRRLLLEDSKHFPFCSERCRLVDLGSWLNEEYRVVRPLSAPARDPEAPFTGWDEDE